jgi:Rad3-related DNA helicase
MVGIPYPNIKDPFIIQKKQHLEAIYSLSSNKSKNDVMRGDEWYFMLATRTINQSIGRVIRHANDFGCIFLIDSRYCEPKMQKELPKWALESLLIPQSI